MPTMQTQQTQTPQTVLIIGAGFAGLGMAIQLRKAGIDDFVVLEKGRTVGGCWRDNVYPGAACDVPSHLYSFSFEPNASWSRKFAPQDEILAYLERCADKYDLRRNIRLETEVDHAELDERAGLWRVATTSGERFEARIVVSACGQLNRPAMPKLAGMETFEGAQFHSARWHRGCDLTGKRVAVIGTGASAIQIVPAIIDRVQRLTLFQRSAAYVLPKPDRAYPAWERVLLSLVPLLQLASRARIYASFEVRALAFHRWQWLLRLARRGFMRRLRQQVPGEALRRKLTPDYDLGCKRVLISNDYYPALTRSNAEVVTEAIERVTPRGIVTADGREHEVDVIVYCTGFKATEFLAPMRLLGRGGRDLNEAWQGGAEAYLGIAVAGFPNLFMLYGPNTNLGHNSIVYMLESQIHYVMECVHEIDAHKVRLLEPTRAVQSAFNDELQRRIANSVWSAGCTSWYQTEGGKNTNNWPGFTFDYRRRTRQLVRDHYHRDVGA